MGEEVNGKIKERARNFLRYAVNSRRIAELFNLSDSELRTMVYLGLNDYVSFLDKSLIEGRKRKEDLFEITKDVRGIKVSDLCNDLFFHPAMGSRIVNTLEVRDYLIELSVYNCRRISDGRVREFTLSKKGNDLYKEIAQRL